MPFATRRFAARLLAGLAACASGLALAQTMPEVPAPKGATVEQLGESMRVNGREVRMQQVLVPQSPDEVAKHYRVALGKQTVDKQLKDMRVLGARDGEHFITVRIRATPSGQTEAWVMTTPAQPEARPPSAPFALPAGSQLMTTVETLDKGRRALTLLAVNQSSVAANHDFIERSLRDRGYALVAAEAPTGREQRRVLLFQKGTQDVMVTIAEINGMASLTINASEAAP